MTYLAYDIRGIQSFIFAVPRLRYIVGGSALVDRFDHKTARDIADECGATWIHSGGGKGAFYAVDESNAEQLQSRLVEESRRIGLDLRIRRATDFSDAANSVDRLFPYLPSGADLDGPPCPESGLYPVRNATQAHPVIRRRAFDRGDELRRRFEVRYLPDSSIHPALGGSCAFFGDVEDGSPGARALGSRNRWAVVCMDGNEIGRQFGHDSIKTLSADQRMAWIQRASQALSDVTKHACSAGIAEVLRQWIADLPADRQDLEDEDGALVLPLRPLVVGGDDLIVLCHASHAMAFVREVARVFGQHSRELATAARKDGIELWPATGGELSISAGVLFAPTGLPLASAIPYAETLLAQAKQRGRAAGGGAGSRAVEACVDWESVTEGMLDHPALRRARELVFLDGDDGGKTRVELTRRPYTLDEFEDLERLARDLFLEGRDRLPGSVAHDLLPGLRAGRHDRALFYDRLGKNHPGLRAELLEPEAPGNRGHWNLESRDGTRVLRTNLIDAFLLAQESRRMSWETAR